MANIQNLQEKVTKAQENVEKKKATIVRHEKQLVKKVAILEKASGRAVDLENVDAYKWVDGKSTDYYWEACEVSGKLRDIDGANKKLKEAERILAGHVERLDAEINRENFINENAPQVIKDFLEQWKEKAIEWYKRRYVAYLEFAKNLDEEVKQAEAELGIGGYRRPTREQERQLKEMELDWKSVEARKAGFAGAIVLQMKTYRNQEEREAWLEKTIEQDKKFKMFDLINRVTNIAGEITDAQYLKISNVGNLNGYIIGTKGKAKVETIGAGGWNIQVFHYRTLVHKMD